MPPEALVDPRINPELSGLPTDATNGEEGVNYLRRLKGAAADGAPAGAPAKGGGGPATDATSFAWKDVRQSPRLRCSGSVKFRTEGSDVPMWGTLTDISLHGCYVEMNATFPIDTKVQLVLKSFGIGIQVPGTVRTSYPFLGMGICFTEIEPEQQVRLKQLLDTLIGRGAVASDGSSQARGATNIPGPPDPQAFFDKITEFFQKHQMLSRTEFYEIAKWASRS
jgi:hypothetical protein